MTEHLFDPGPPAEGTLTDRQRLVLAMVRAPGGTTDALAGAALHRRRYEHLGVRPCSCCDPEGAPCGYADDVGREVLARLRALGYGLVRRQATGQWLIPGETPPAHSSQGDDIPY